MKSKFEIACDWLPRYTGTALEDFRDYILLVNFSSYLVQFSEAYQVPIRGVDKPMQTASNDTITIINFGMGSAMAATVMDLLSAISPRAVLFLGKCGGLKKKTRIGDLIIPIAAIRGEATSDEYLLPSIPALPSFALQRAISSMIIEANRDYWTGTVFTTNRRLWEHDEQFKVHLRETRAMAIDMETATVFAVGFANEIPRGALLLVSDNPMIPEGIKTGAMDRATDSMHLPDHLRIGVKALEELAHSGESVKHLRFDD